jgi:hypothetical protein
MGCEHAPPFGSHRLVPTERSLCVTDDLVATAIEAAGGQNLWNTLRGLTIDLSVGGPVWVLKGWRPGTTFEQKVTLIDYLATLTRIPADSYGDARSAVARYEARSSAARL